MATLPPPPSPTIDAIYSYYSKHARDGRRNHLGASQIGNPCERALWYSFRWCRAPVFSGRILRLFETGLQEEKRVLQNLRDIGINVWDTWERGIQISFSVWGGHFAGSLDGVGVGFPEAPKTPHVIEIKTMNEKSFNSLKKNGVVTSKPDHYSQMLVYMAQLNIPRAFYFAVNKNTDEIYGERIYEDPDDALLLEEKAERVIFSEGPLEKLGESMKSFSCKWCDYNGMCWETALPEVSCRTCAHITPERNGGWVCWKRGARDRQSQIIGCDQHVFIPYLVPLAIYDASQDLGTVTYEGGIINGPGNIGSWELGKHIA
jgi:hypothetical protein